MDGSGKLPTFYRSRSLFRSPLGPGENYAEDKPLSKAIIKGTADLSKLVSASEGREALGASFYHAGLSSEARNRMW